MDSNLADKINKEQAAKVRKKAPGFIAFAGDPKKDRPTKKETRDEINAIRKYGKTEQYKGKYIGGGKTEDQRLN
jgi:hypothetical protein